MDRRDKQQELNRLLDLIERSKSLEEQYTRLAFMCETAEKENEHKQSAANWRAERLHARLEIHRLFDLV
jgi:hypothetical protein